MKSELSAAQAAAAFFQSMSEQPPEAAPAENSMLAMALAYAERGWKVFPCWPKTKKPMTPHGFENASDDPKVITNWWTKCPDANIGLALDGLAVIDVDPRHNGHLTLEDWQEKYGPLPDTLTQISGGGGRHLIYLTPPGVTFKNKSFAPGLEIKTTGGYILLSPSIHDKTFKEYVWDGTKKWFDYPIVVMPTPWTDAILDAQGRKNETETTTDVVPEGQRHSFLLSEAGAMRRRKMSAEEMLPSLLVMNKGRCVPPMEKAEVEQLAKSMEKYKPNEATVARIKRDVRELERARARGAPEKTINDAWKVQMAQTLRGDPKRTLANSIVALRFSPEFKGAFRYNEFSLEVEATRDLCGGRIKAGSKLDDTADSWITFVLQHEYLVDNPSKITNEAIAAVARDHSHHPVRERFKGLTWDGVPRVDGWLSTLLGAERNEYTNTVGRCWLISAVARIMEPGCQADCMIVLEGKQGIGKSTALRYLGGAWFTDDIANIGNKDACIQLRGKTIIEFSELDAMGKAEVSRVKSFVSRRVDNYRPPYGRTAVDVPRQTVFAGTTNQSNYLSDDENRRFWPVRCGKIDTDGLKAVVDQLWAEAYALYNDGATWHLPQELAQGAASSEQEDRRIDDPWSSRIQAYSEDLKEVTSEELMTKVLAIPIRDQGRAEEMRVSGILRQLGWKQLRCRRDGLRVRVFFPVD